jgi:kynureninase
MKKGFTPISSAEGWQLSTPSLLLYASHKAALDIFDEAGWENLQIKQKLLNNYLWFILDEINKPYTEKIIEFITPRNEKERGCQVSMLLFESGREIFDNLKNNGVMADWREPNVIRIAPVPLYNTFEEIWKFGKIIQSILNNN